jgi:pyruvate formate lyase activating enzyme
LLDGVCITGGEPTLHKDLPELLRSIRELGFKIKLDTNGYKPQILQQLLKEGLVDHVAMDIKNSPALYAETVGLKQVQLEKLEESIRLLMEGPVSYELRTTVAEQLHTETSILQMGQWLAGLVPGKKPVKLFLQPFVDRDTVLLRNLSAPTPEKLEIFVKLLTPYIEEVSVRGE